MGGSSTQPSAIDRVSNWAESHASTSNSPPGGNHQPAIQSPPLFNPNSLPTGPHNDGNGVPSTSTQSGSPPSSIQADGASSSKVIGEKRQSNKSNKNDPWTTRFRKGTKRFWLHTKHAICYSWINVLLLFVPIGIAAEAAHLAPGIIFAMNAIAIIPLAGLLSHATETVASRLGDTLGALLNVSFGNAVELIIFIALVKDEIRIVQASLIGSILANLLLILGMAFLLGGLRFREQIYNSTVTQMSACLLSLSVTSLLLPTAFHASFSSNDNADHYTLKLSRGTSVVLLLIYVLYILFQLKSHAYLYESTPQNIIDEESHPGVLADMLNSSSSDSSSSSSSSDSDSSSGSHTTAKRIKRAFRNRRRRKSNASSGETHSNRSGSNSPPRKPRKQHKNIPLVNPQESGPATGQASAAILSGDEADIDAEVYGKSSLKRNPEESDITGEPSSLRGHKSKPKRAKRETTKHHKGSQLPSAIAGSEDHSTSGPRVGFAENVEIVSPPPEPKRPFGIRQISNIPLRPALPTVFTNNVFSMPPPTNSAPAAGTPSLRRTTSLPDRLNGTQYIGTRASKSPIPPFPGRVASADYATSDDEDDDEYGMSRTAAIVMLLGSTALVAVCAEFLVDNIPAMVESSSISQAFIGLIILPIVGNAAEHVTAVTVAAKNKMDLAIGVAVGSSIQIAIFVTPLVVILGWCMGKEMTLYFNLFETISLFVTAFVVNFLVLDGRSNYLEGALLIAAYVIIALAAFFYPDGADQSTLGGNGVARRV